MSPSTRADALPSTVANAPGGQAAVDSLVELLDLERLELNLFRGFSPPQRSTRVFGGQVAAQALVAAGRTVPADRSVHSLHAYFIRPGDPSIPIVFETERVRDGRSFTTRRVLAVQRGEKIFALSASFQVAEEGLEHTMPAPDVPGPDELPDMGSLVAEGQSEVWVSDLPRPLEMRYVGDPGWQEQRTAGVEGPQHVWMRADGTLPDDPLLHVCLLTYASDLSLLGSVPARHAAQDLTMASLDHAMWFHQPFRADEWFLYSSYSPAASGGRGLASGRFTNREGTLFATAMQEGLVRLPRKRA